MNEFGIMGKVRCHMGWLWKIEGSPASRKSGSAAGSE